MKEWTAARCKGLISSQRCLLLSSNVSAPESCSCSVLGCEQAYAINYTGHGKTARLQFVAKQAAGSQLELDALRMAADELRKVCMHAPATKGMMGLHGVQSKLLR